MLRNKSLKKKRRSKNNNISKSFQRRGKKYSRRNLKKKVRTNLNRVQKGGDSLDDLTNELNEEDIKKELISRFRRTLSAQWEWVNELNNRKGTTASDFVDHVNLFNLQKLYDEYDKYTITTDGETVKITFETTHFVGSISGRIKLNKKLKKKVLFFQKKNPEYEYKIVGGFGSFTRLYNPQALDEEMKKYLKNINNYSYIPRNESPVS